MSSETIRTLIVDDSSAMRQLLSRALEDDADISVVGTAANGVTGLHRVGGLRPHVVVLDVHMPEMDGLQMLAELRKRHPEVAVIMFSEATERGAAVTIDALLMGASDYLAKGSSASDPARGLTHIREALIPKIKAVARRPGADAPARPRRRRAARANVPEGAPPRAIVVASSTGGPQALEVFLGGLAPQVAVPVFVVQHVPAVFTRQLANRLAAKCNRDVREGHHGARVEPGQVWIAPGDRHMVLASRAGAVTLRLTEDPPENSCRPAADPLFRSASALYGDALVCVVLTGMGSDGLRGCETARAAGARVIVQDEATSVVWGMPARIAEKGLADAVLPLGEISGLVNSLVNPALHGPAEAVD